MLHKSGYHYISTDITQAFYLTQNNMWEGLFPCEVKECLDTLEGLNETARTKMIHIPYWKLWDLKESDLEADIMVSNHNLAEMHVNSLRFYLKYGKRLMRNSPYKLFIAQNVGGQVTKNWYSVFWIFKEMGYSLLYKDTYFMIFCLNEKENISPIDIQKLLNKAYASDGELIINKNIKDKTAGDFVVANERMANMQKVSLNEIESFFASLDENNLSPGEEFWDYIDVLKRPKKHRISLKSKVINKFRGYIRSIFMK